jgi:hypothetical protein
MAKHSKGGRQKQISQTGITIIFLLLHYNLLLIGWSGQPKITLLQLSLFGVENNKRLIRGVTCFYVTVSFQQSADRKEISYADAGKFITSITKRHGRRCR